MGSVQAEFELPEHLIAPLSAGTALGKARIVVDGSTIAAHDLYAVQDVPRGGHFPARKGQREALVPLRRRGRAVPNLLAERRVPAARRGAYLTLRSGFPVRRTASTRSCRCIAAGRFCCAQHLERLAAQPAASAHRAIRCTHEQWAGIVGALASRAGVPGTARLPSGDARSGAWAQPPVPGRRRRADRVRIRQRRIPRPRPSCSRQGIAAVTREDTAGRDATSSRSRCSPTCCCGRKRGSAAASEAMLLREGWLTEGSSSTVFVVKGDRLDDATQRSADPAGYDARCGARARPAGSLRRSVLSPQRNSTPRTKSGLPRPDAACCRSRRIDGQRRRRAADRARTGSALYGALQRASRRRIGRADAATMEATHDRLHRVDSVPICRRRMSDTTLLRVPDRFPDQGHGQGGRRFPQPRARHRVAAFRRHRRRSGSRSGRAAPDAISASP